MKKIVVAKLFLYRYRFYIGFSIIGLVFAALVFMMPMVAPGGVSRAEMGAAVRADEVSVASLMDGDVVDLPFRSLQRLSIAVFGLSSYSVKLPAIVIGFFTGVLLILLLNRWFSTNVAVLASGFVAASAFFLGQTGVGTSSIMVIFWVVLMLWLGAKLVGERDRQFVLLLGLAGSLALACYSPLFIYLVVLIGLVGLAQPHLRFFLKKYRKWQLILAAVVFAGLLTPMVYGVVVNGESLRAVALGSGGDYWQNIEGAYTPFFSFAAGSAGGVLAPLFGMATVALLIIGLIGSAGKLRTARSVVTGALTIFAIVAAGLYPAMALVMFVPILLLTASGIELTIGRWYELFPENPYARLFGVFPIALFAGIVMVSGVTHFFYGYQYAPAVAVEFSDDIGLVREYVPAGGVLIVPEDELALRFYKILERSDMVTVSAEMPDRPSEVVATLGKWQGEVGMPLQQIITSPRASNSDRLYLYKK